MIEDLRQLQELTSCGTLQLQEQINEQKRLAKHQRRIAKQKKKLILSFQFQKSISSKSSIGQDGTVMEDEEGVTQELKLCDAIIPRAMNTYLNFLFNGFINIEIAEIQMFSLTESFGIRVFSVEKFPHYFSTSHEAFEFSKEYDIAIYLLEASQNQISYEIAQDLKTYKLINEDNLDLMNRFHAEIELNSQQKQLLSLELADLQALEHQRKLYRDAKVAEFIDSNMTEDDFYFCCDGGINFQDGSVKSSKLRISKNIFALVGVDDLDIESFLMRNDIFSRMIPFESRKRLTVASLKLRLSTHYTQQQQLNGNSGLTSEKYEMDSFEIRTIDGITIICDVVITRFTVEFPQELQLTSSYSQLNELEQFQCVQFQITCNHLDQILQQRMNNRNSGEMSTQDLEVQQLHPSDRVRNAVTENFEYSMLSSIFIEKFYEKEMRMLEPISSYSNGIKNKENRKQKIFRLKKTCGFRKLSPS